MTQSDAQVADTVTVSLIATIRNEEASIADFVEAIRRQTRQPDEVVIVDGGSEDRTLDLLRSAVGDDETWRIIEAPGVNISRGRNMAIAAASHSIVAVTDAGASADPAWLEHLLEPFERDAVDVVSGFFEAGGETRFERALATVIVPRLEEIDPDRFLPSSRSVAFRRHVVTAVGGYPEWLEHCEDLVLDLALKQAGARFAMAPEAIVRWRARSSLRAFARQYFFYARGDGHAGLWPKRHAARYAAYAAGTVLLTLAPSRRWAGPLLVLGCLAHMRPYVRRLARSGIPHGERPQAYLLAPVIVLTGDVAKIFGYAVGRAQRRTIRGQTAK